ncbi:hypothetical protein [Arcticibacter sp. MXS-1]|uniref:hypothetical protein n=1 Tax=Arcticibacter sp. MXS-1 TaxID=3341726 RepID=UPI0035A85736
MYMRYFLWNFAGRQNDIQGYGERTRGNWITGIKPIDAVHLGDQSHLPPSIVANEGYNRFYGLPLLIGLIGLFFHLKRRPEYAGVNGLLFFFTGMAIILYLNQGPQEVRERDYAYAGSFYAFAIWIGLGVPGLIQLLKRFAGEKRAIVLSVTTALICAPAIMAVQGWDDHNRSGNYIPRDMAINYLESCAPNAILFTNADNDTYPLWYAQEVEGVRPDVRIVNLQLAYNDSYIDQLKEKIRASDPLPLAMSKDKYVKGVRDYMPYADYGITDSVELRDIFELLTSDNDNDKVQMRDGSRLNFLPTRKFKLTIDKGQLLKTGTVTPQQLGLVADKMEWSIGGNFITRVDLALIDILSHNNWQRPIYFAASLPDDSYFGLDQYLQLEGFAYRLLPFKRLTGDERDKSEITNSMAMYTHVMSRFKLDSFKKAAYLDPESKRVTRNTWDAMNTLTSNLLNEGDTQRAKAVMDKAIACLPLKDYELIDTANKSQTVFNLYQLNKKTEAKALSVQAVSFISAELNYYANLPKEEQRANTGIIRYAFAVLENYRRAAEAYGQNDLDKKIRELYSSVEAKLI